METQLAPVDKDGMDLVALISLAPLIPILMELNASAPIHKIIVYPGNIIMDSSVFISRIHALKEPDGTALFLTVFLLENVLKDFIETGLIVNLSLKDAYLLLNGQMENAQEEEIVLMEHIKLETIVSL